MTLALLAFLVCFAPVTVDCHGEAEIVNAYRFTWKTKIPVWATCVDDDSGLSSLCVIGYNWTAAGDIPIEAPCANDASPEPAVGGITYVIVVAVDDAKNRSDEACP